MSASRVKVAVIIPARYGSTRLPGKPLAEIAGHPMIYHVYVRARSVENVGEVIVATDDARIADAVRGFGGNAHLTSAKHRNGTERIAEVASNMDADIIVNLQADEPLIDTEAVGLAIRALLESDEIPMSTIMTRLRSEDEVSDPNVVKVVCDQRGFALYFSRSPIPYLRSNAQGAIHKHIGVYAYRREFLLSLSKMKPTPLERAESLEQLRALENGYKIKVIETDYDSPSVDTPEDLEKIRNLFPIKPEVLSR